MRRNLGAVRKHPQVAWSSDFLGKCRYRYNTGIIVCHMIDHAVGLIKANPIGFSLP